MHKSMLIIGRFQPFHLGHLHIIKEYYDDGYFIKIVVGSIKQPRGLRDPFSMQERDDMIRLALDESGIRRFALYHIPDYPGDDEAWLQSVLDTVGAVDILFSGNEHVNSIFEQTGIKMQVYDESKDRFGDISATAIRRQWLEKESPEGLPKSVFHYLLGLRAHERLRFLRDDG